MNAAVARPYTVPQSGGSGRAIALAVVMHLLLGGLLFFGIRWQSSPPAVIQAELWSAVPQTAAPAPRPVPPPPRVEAPRPEPKVEPDPPPPKADIVERAPAKVEARRKPVVEPPKVQPKPQPAAAKVETRQKPEPTKLPPKPAVDAPPRAPSELDALLAAAGKESIGKDAQTSGPRGRDTYIGRLQNAIRSQMRYPETSDNPVVKVRVEQLPTGEVSNVTVIRSSGVRAFDDAVERATRSASPLPRDEQGRVDRVLEFDYKLRP